MLTSWTDQLLMLPFKGPDEIYGELFHAVQSQHVFSDSKTFVDATPKSDADDIMAAFRRLGSDEPEELRAFVAEHFVLPAQEQSAADLIEVPPVRDRIEALWNTLSRAADRVDPNSSLIALPRPYIVPGGRFREIYYWDSYFTMLGLAEAGRVDIIENMVDNFAFLIDTIGFIPNGNRSYYCTRSQPPFFVLMVELLADVREDASVVQNYLPQLRKEYDFWMRGSETLHEGGASTLRVVRVGGGCLNRYWDDSDAPRQESYAEDLEHAAHAERDPHDYYRNIRAACESGWDFSSRWLADAHKLESIRAGSILPVDLNALLYHLETCLAGCYADLDPGLAAHFTDRAEYRKRELQTLFFDQESSFFTDLDCSTLEPIGVRSLAAAYPLFFEVATAEQAAHVAATLQHEFLAPGGWMTTPVTSGQQWDRPNGWAPLQWIVFEGLSNYGYTDEAELGGRRWAENNIDVYERTGRLLEKYDVENPDSLAAGGEYDVQDGFGWTNGVLLALMNRLNL